ncbi:MAG TPA: hypothetical protein PLC25_04680 [Bacilli bacterium]|nr:hypothetical protein [Bacilli bacterium]
MIEEIEQFLVGEPYRQKINFAIFKRYDHFENNAYMTCVSKGIPNDEQLEEILSYLQPEQKLLMSLKKGQTINHPKIVVLYEHPKDFHSLFNTYIYYHVGYFDPHPRLFHECIFYGKKIIYINKKNVKDGGYFRYYDAITNGLKNVWLDENDEIIKNMLS